MRCFLFTFLPTLKPYPNEHILFSLQIEWFFFLYEIPFTLLPYPNGHIHSWSSMYINVNSIEPHHSWISITRIDYNTKTSIILCKNPKTWNIQLGKYSWECGRLFPLWAPSAFGAIEKALCSSTLLLTHQTLS